MKVLVAVASRHGSTREIAETIAAELRANGLTADTREVAAVASVDCYDAVILGSAVYMGSWLPEAQRFVTHHEAALASVPVWLFSSGPLGAEEPKPLGDPAQMPDILRATHAREHRIFVGKLEPRTLGFGERLIMTVVHPPIGDFRDWDAIREWARLIAADLATPVGLNVRQWGEALGFHVTSG
ncbi:MAG: flavodoxin domain-containing protein [Chloroflexi bacterium]|nr:flavodoxin domain-containing protein [Chloroflexota bacterium]